MTILDHSITLIRVTAIEADPTAAPGQTRPSELRCLNGGLHEAIAHCASCIRPSTCSNNDLGVDAQLHIIHSVASPSENITCLVAVG